MSEAPPPDPSRIGVIVEKYRLTRRIGAGGMGEIFEAQHLERERRAAVKLLHPQFAQDREIATRFLHEARAVNLTRHPALVDIFGSGNLPDGTPYLIMEYLEGRSLRAHLEIRGGRLPAAEAIHLCQAIADALAAVHAQGIAHRDLKPDNIMILDGASAAGVTPLRIFDFGLAKLRPEHMVPGATILQTRPGSLMGTPIYMSPEQCIESGEITSQTDVYALGVMLFSCLAGRPPFVAKSRGDAGLLQLCAMHVSAPPPALSLFAPGVDPLLERLVHAMLAKVPAERPTMRAIVEELRLIAAGPPKSADLRTELAMGTSLPTLVSSPAPGRPGAVAPRRSREPAARRYLAGLAVMVGLLLLWVVGLVLRSR